MEAGPHEIQELEATLIQTAVALVDRFGPEGIGALARAAEKIRDHLDLSPGSLLLAPIWFNKSLEKKNHAS